MVQCMTAPSLHHHRTSIVPPALRHHCTLTTLAAQDANSATRAPSMHHYHTTRVSSQEWPAAALRLALAIEVLRKFHHRTIIAPSLHHHCTITAPSPHHHCTITAPSPHPAGCTLEVTGLPSVAYVGTERERYKGRYRGITVSGVCRY